MLCCGSDEIKRASIEDGKNIDDHPPVDSHLDWGGRLHRALELLDKAHREVSEEEDNRFAEGLQERSLATSRKRATTSKRRSASSVSRV